MFRPPFSDLWAMDVDELQFWLDRATWIAECERRRG
jgi:hypothetical protein